MELKTAQARARVQSSARNEAGAFSAPEKIIAQFGLEEGHHVADFGTGSGHYALAAARAVGSGRVYAIDIQPELLRRLKNLAHAEYLHNIYPLHGDFEKSGDTKLKEGSVDAVFLCNVLFQLKDKEAALGEMKRVLRPKGRALVVDWADSFGGLGPTPAEILTENEAQALLERAGFSVQRTINAGAHHWGVIARLQLTTASSTP